MNKLEEKVLQIINENNLIENGDKLVLGVSGGPDSIAMLNILNEIRKADFIHFEIVVAHINHGLRENAKLDEEFVLHFCKKIGVECFVLHADIKQIAKQEKRGLEETGRTVRYDFFQKVLEKTNANKIAIAHNNNDKVETIIMNALRGSGIAGLKGIELQNDIFIRPLIFTKREEIEKYCKEKKLNPRHDESNDDNTYTRNKIRNIVIPYIKENFNPNILETMNRLSEISLEETEYLEKQTQKAYTRVCMQENIFQENVYNKENESTIILDLKKFNEEERIIQKRIILLSIRKLFGSTKGIEKIHIEDMIKLCNKKIGNKYLIPNKKTKIVIKNKKIYLIAVK